MQITFTEPIPFPLPRVLYAPSILRCLLLGAAMYLLAPATQAQYRASIQGVVTDSSGAVIPNATVTLTNKETGQALTSTTNASGVYNFNTLPPSQFSITIERDGFQKKVIDNVAVIPEQANAFNIQLQVGQSTQTVTVSGSEAPALDTETASVGSIITSNQIQHLPSFNHDVFQLAQLTPGVFGDASRGTGGGALELPGNQGPGGTAAGAGGIFQTENGPQIQTRGGQYETNGITIDGKTALCPSYGPEKGQ
jgi:Carboxypeptidase regulatory-like domain